VNTLIVLFNLRTDADAATYEQWAKTTDLPVVRALGGVSSFDVYRTSGLFGSNSPAPYNYVEVIDIADMQQFSSNLSTATMRDIASQFQTFADNPMFILSEKIS
jgi:hypothetical protein